MKTVLFLSLVTLFASSAFADTFKCGDAKLISGAHNMTVEKDGQRISLGLQDDASWVGSVGYTTYTYYRGTQDEMRLQISKENSRTGKSTIISDTLCE